jgi:hypothetical protein
MRTPHQGGFVMRSNFDDGSGIVRPEDFGTMNTEDHASPVGLRLKPDRRQRNVPVLPHPDRRKRASTAPISGSPAGKIEIHHR